MNVIFWIECIGVSLGLLITVNTVGNLRAFHRLSDYATDASGDLAFVSVLIPARNEERSIGPCLESLVAQDYPAYEIVILDDGSDDRTAEIARAVCARSCHARLMLGEPLPDGWYGKAFACSQLAANARGDIILFTDADTVHSPATIRGVVGAIAAGAQVVTAFPEQEAGSFAEHLSTWFMLFSVWSFLPVGRVWSDPSPRFAAANGQVLAFMRAAYDDIGGHASVRQSVLDDVALVRRAKRLGLRVRLANGAGTVRARMYHGFSEVWRGFAKNALALTGDSIGAAAGCAAALTLLYLSPPLILAVGLVGGKQDWTWLLLPALLTLFMLVQSAIVAHRTRGAWWLIAAHPLSVLFFIAILANSVRWRVRGVLEWKGRNYPA